MATLRLLLVAALLALPLWVIQTAPAHACVCAIDAADPDPLASTVARTDLIVVGEIGEMLVLPPESVAHPESLGSATPVEIKFEVSEFLKGSAANPVLLYYPVSSVHQEDGKITSVFGGTDCDILAHLGDNYVMFLSKVDSLRYTTQVCSGTQAFDDTYDIGPYVASIRAAVARGPTLPITGSAPSSHRDTSNIPLIAVSALAGLGLAANAAYALRRSS